MDVRKKTAENTEEEAVDSEEAGDDFKMRQILKKRTLNEQNDLFQIHIRTLNRRRRRLKKRTLKRWRRRLI